MKTRTNETKAVFKLADNPKELAEKNEMLLKSKHTVADFIGLSLTEATKKENFKDHIVGFSDFGLSLTQFYSILCNVVEINLFDIVQYVSKFEIKLFGQLGRYSKSLKRVKFSDTVIDSKRGTGFITKNLNVLEMITMVSQLLPVQVTISQLKRDRQRAMKKFSKTSEIYTKSVKFRVSNLLTHFIRLLMSQKKLKYFMNQNFKFYLHYKYELKNLLTTCYRNSIPLNRFVNKFVFSRTLEHVSFSIKVDQI